MQLTNNTMKIGLLLIIFALISVSAFGQNTKTVIDSNTIFVKLKSTSNPAQWLLNPGQSSASHKIAGLINQYNIISISQPYVYTHDPKLSTIIKFKLGKGSKNGLINTLQNHPELSSLEFGNKFKPIFNSSDTSTNLVWHDEALYLWKAHSITRGDTGVTIAVIDLVFNKNLTDLQGKWWINPHETPNDGIDNDSNGYIDDINGWNFGNNTNDPFFMLDSLPKSKMDKYNHGTAVSSMVVGEGANQNSSIGACPNCRVMPLNLELIDSNDYNKNWENHAVDPYDAFVYATYNGADIINFSMGVLKTGVSAIEDIIYSFCDSMGVIMVTGTGNDFNYTADTAKEFYPSNDTRFISVGAVTQDLFKAKFSNANNVTKVDIMAPGDNVLVGGIYNEQYYNQSSGTSLSAPLISGILGLIKSQFPNKTKSELIEVLYNSCNNIDYKNFEYANQNGYGIPNAYAAVLDSNLPRADIYTKSLEQMTYVDSIVEFRCNNFNNGKYIWNWGDGTSSTTNSNAINKKYLQSGLYTITLISIDTLSYYRDTIMKSKWFYVDSYCRARYSYNSNWILGSDYNLHFSDSNRVLNKDVTLESKGINGIISRLKQDTAFQYCQFFETFTGGVIMEKSLGLATHSDQYYYDTLNDNLEGFFFQTTFRNEPTARPIPGILIPDFSSDSFLLLQSFSKYKNSTDQVLKIAKIDNIGNHKNLPPKLIGDPSISNVNQNGELIYEDISVIPNFDSSYYWLLVRPDNIAVFGDGDYILVYKLMYNDTVECNYHSKITLSDSGNINSNNYKSITFNKLGNTIAIQYDTFVKIYNFNNTTGDFTFRNRFHIDGINGLSFRSQNLVINENGNILYGVQESDDFQLFELFQIDISQNSFCPPPTLVDRGYSERFCNLEIGPDGIIYINNYFSDRLGAITMPDQLLQGNYTNDCGYVKYAVDLNTQNFLVSRDVQSSSLYGLPISIDNMIPDSIVFNFEFTACDSISLHSNFPNRIFHQWVVNSDTVTNINPVARINPMGLNRIELMVDGVQIVRFINLIDSIKNFAIELSPYVANNTYFLDSAFRSVTISLNENTIFNSSDSVYWYYQEEIHQTGLYTDSYSFSKPGTYYGFAKNSCYSIPIKPVNIKFPCDDYRYNTAFKNAYTNLQSIPGLDTGVIILDGDYTIAANQTFRINNCVLFFTEGSSITVMPGAKFVADFVQFFSCNNWKGITIMGNPNNGNFRDTSATIHGVGIFTNCKFNDAETAIKSTNGGYIYSTKNMFNGNLHDIQIKDYSYDHNSTIANNNFLHNNVNDCIFETSQDYFEKAGKKVYYKVLLQNIKGQIFNNNTFQMMRYMYVNTPLYENINIIMEATNHISVLSDTLWGNNSDIMIYDTSSFANRYINNDFNYGYKNPYFPDFGINASVGLSISNADSLTIDRNLFNRVNFGIEFYQSDSAHTANHIKRNRFETCNYGLVSATHENPMNYPNQNDTTKVKCNVNCNTFNDCGYAWVGTGRYLNQGSLSISAGNNFNNTTFENVVILDTVSKYYYFQLEPKENPNNSNSFVILLDNAQINNTNKPLFSVKEVPSLNPSNCISKRSNFETAITRSFDELPAIFPNPTSGILNLINFDADYYNLSISDITGKSLIQNIIINNSKINLSNLPAGLYFITIKSTLNEKYTFKIIKFD